MDELFPPTLPRFVKTKTIAEAIGRTPAGVRGLVARGLLPKPFRFGTKGPLLFITSRVRQAVAKLLEEGTAGE